MVILNFAQVKVKQLIPPTLLQVFRKLKKLVNGNSRVNEADDISGDQVFCSVCKSHFKKFAPAGFPSRDNARCYTCQSMERHRLIWKFINDKTSLLDSGNSGKKIRLLHFAPELSFYNHFCSAPNIEYYPCDYEPELFNYDGNVAIKKVDIGAIPFPDGFFDVILCNHVLEHIPDDQTAMKELRRVLHSSGWGIFQSPIDYKRENTYEDFSITLPADRAKAFGQEDHVRWYGRDYSKRLESAGFAVDENNFVGSFTDEEIFKFGFMRTELIYYCTAG